MQTRVLLVEDDRRIRQALGLALWDEGCQVIEAESGEEALWRLRTLELDVVLLDLMLPGMDGLDVCRTLRAEGDLPIIITTARSDTADVVAGLEAGADDYVTKPLVAGELAARIRALLRRSQPGEGPGHRSGLRVGEIEIWSREGVVRRGDEEIHLTRIEFRLLVELAAARGAVVTREELLQRVWGYDYFGDTRLLTCTSGGCAARSSEIRTIPCCCSPFAGWDIGPLLAGEARCSDTDSADPESR